MRHCFFYIMLAFIVSCSIKNSNPILTEFNQLSDFKNFDAILNGGLSVELNPDLEPLNAQLSLASNAGFLVLPKFYKDPLAVVSACLGVILPPSTEFTASFMASTCLLFPALAANSLVFAILAVSSTGARYGFSANSPLKDIKL